MEERSLMRNFVAWFVLFSLGLYALLLLNGALFSAWMSGGLSMVTELDVKIDEFGHAH